MPVARLADRATLLVTGEPAEHFLQTLVTADLDSLAEGEMRPSALLTPQGKILFDFLIGRVPGGFRLDIAKPAAEAFAKRLALYRLRTKVAIEPSDEPVHALWDEDAPGALRDQRFPDPVWRVYGAAPEGVEHCEPADFERLRIRAGVAEAETDYSASEVFPHDVLLDQNGGVSFKKGCFVGQEVVSRMQHRGTARRRLMLVEADGHLTPGVNIEAGGRTIGTVLSAAGCDGFALIRIDKLADALVADAELTADGVTVTATVPPWAGFALPEPAAAGAATDAGDAE
ncbi:folate-binding protein YgfZ [Aurantimonas sp. HBX-1]|uniref:CAF17-like 4Fe-4S cluster assembly/insertion protein YgfZ n=1 Tax=Aurantimonas sp. HBX-1 TaxID=2906072 RepID=UPI001F3E1C36|nr:folate-binding protein YgfZ [Aurantimonas sp. HBX-1]UIJ70551.1 folate-binding protein YgfZ [Aurantimonas sp. HBX-1]